jgi:predicted O-methyltransferase YrrM
VAYNLRYGDIPWLTQEANSILLGTLHTWMKGFEWGSGKSTLFFSKRVSFLVSIEHDYYWYRLVRSWSDREHINNCDLRFINSPQRYVEIINEFPDEYFDFILIDGVLRLRCLLSALSKLKRGGFLIFDNTETYGNLLDSYSFL